MERSGKKTNEVQVVNGAKEDGSPSTRDNDGDQEVEQGHSERVDWEKYERKGISLVASRDSFLSVAARFETHGSR